MTAHADGRLGFLVLSSPPLIARRLVCPTIDVIPFDAELFRQQSGDIASNVEDAHYFNPIRNGTLKKNTYMRKCEIGM